MTGDKGEIPAKGYRIVKELNVRDQHIFSNAETVVPGESFLSGPVLDWRRASSSKKN
jgi:hypothetical protein